MAARFQATASKIVDILFTSGMIGGGVGAAVGGVNAIQMYREGHMYLPVAGTHIGLLPFVGFFMGYSIGFTAPISIPYLTYQMLK